MAGIAWTFRGVGALLLAAFVYFAYLPGLTGALYYDDYSNLDPLKAIESPADTKEFVLGGNAGPLGRPIALLTFLPHSEGWPQNSVAILRINVLIHIANALILLVLAYMLLRLSADLSSIRSYFVALSAVALWALLPINVSTNLIAIQRMTSLSAFFGLIGLTGYVGGYFLQWRRPVLALLVQGASLGTGTLLAMFTKENGALVPVFALVIHSVLLKEMPIPYRYKVIRGGVLWSGLLLILTYLSPIVHDWFAVSGYRGYSAWERFVSQPGILLQYITLAFAPLPTQFSPFHDDIKIVSETFAIAIPVLVWLLVIVACVAVRQFSPWPIFALFWYLSGHLLESSVINLELYFEHRNYLALFGICLALSYFAWNPVSDWLSRTTPALFMGYIGVIAASLIATTSLWGRPLLAAETWAATNPVSSRAALHLAALDIESGGGDGVQAQRALVFAAKRDRAIWFMDRTIEACPDCIDVHVQALLYACDIRDDGEIAGRFEALLKASKNGKSTLPVIDGIFPMIELAKHGSCGALGVGDVKDLTENLLANPAFASQMYLTRLNFLMANVAYAEGSLDEAKEYLLEAERVGPQALPVLQFQIHIAMKQGIVQDALFAIERRRPFAKDGYRMNHLVLEKLKTAVIDDFSIGRNE